jgi:glycosyltransferase involved in cell wall biosynthesis
VSWGKVAGWSLSGAAALRDRVLRILYLHPFGAFGGATKSLSEMVAALPPGEVVGIAITPSGVAQRALGAAGLETIAVRGFAQWDDTRYGHYRGVRWLILLRELVYWPGTFFALLRARRMQPFDLIHCNEVTALLPALLAKRLLRAPLVVHVRSLQRPSSRGRISDWLRRRLREGANAVVAIDEAVRRSLPADLPVTVIHNGLRDPGAPAAGEREGPLRVAIVGVLHKAKGVHEFVAAGRLLRDRGVDVRLLIVGENIRSVAGLRGRLLRTFDFAHDVRGELESYVEQHGLQQMVQFTGFVSDIASIYRASDVLCFPSHLDAPGRPVFEAALFGLPSIVAMRNPTSDVVVPDRTGICIDAPTPLAIAAAIQALAADRPRVARMGSEARRLALPRFESSRTAASMLALYRQVCARSPAGRERP